VQRKQRFPDEPLFKEIPLSDNYTGSFVGIRMRFHKKESMGKGA
jgi:hypothetical protein